MQKVVSNIMILLMALSLTVACISNKRNSSLRKLQSVRLFHKWQLVSMESGQLIEVKDSAFIHYFDSLILYQVPTLLYTSTLTDIGNDTLIETINKVDVYYEYYVFKKNKKTGLRYSKLKDQVGLRFSVDSLRSVKDFQNLNPYDAKVDSLLYIKEKGDILFETYIPRFRPDSTYPDSTYLFFSKSLSEIEYSFSQALDTIKQKKLFKIVFIYNEIPERANIFKIPRRELSFEISKVNSSNDTGIIALLKRFKQETVDD